MGPQKGFNLLELMVVVVIIGILAVVAIPFFQAYVSRAQVAGALAEITEGKTQAETKINEGLATPVTVASDIGLKVSVRCPTLDVLLGTDGVASITCTMSGSHAVEGNTLSFTRGSNGVWVCTSTVEVAYVPYGCSRG